MRCKIHKRNAVAFSLTTFIALSLLIAIRKNAQSGGARAPSREEHSSSKDQMAQHSDPHPMLASKFQYDTAFNMRKSAYEGNYRQLIRNAHLFPGDPKLVVVVQVHNRPAYLKLLLDSLERASGIQDVLLIFSQDFFSQELAGLVERITFCRVLQIYFPYSTQLYPFEFPGQDPKDCPRDISKEDAKKVHCTNAESPDSYGHYREASFTQTKHHWWWKLHFVWERVRALQGYSGHVLFVEEDNYFLPDFYNFYLKMIKLQKRDCPDCDLLALGNHADPPRFEEGTGKLETTGWLSTQHNIGMGFSKETYYKLMGCSADFCTYDDYNWDWTLQHLSGTCIAKPLKVLAVKAPRVLHTGDCGLHQKDGGCHPEQALRKVREVLEGARAQLFPKTLEVSEEHPVEHKPHVKNGGWGDVRDHALCKNYAKIL